MIKMYNKTTLVNTFAIGLMIALNFLFCDNAKAQTTIYYQSFDTAVFDSIPTNWVRTTTDTAIGWGIDTSNVSTGLYTGASGLHNCVIKNIAGVGTFTLVSPSISTANYDSISILWGARYTTHFSDSGSAVSFDWTSNNGTTWNPVSYVEVPPTSTWGLENNGTAIQIPTTAWHQASVKFRWTARIRNTPSGTYRIDDVTIKGVHTSGINEVNGSKPMPILFMQADNILNIKMNNFSKGITQVKIMNIDGVEVYNSTIEPINQTINLIELSAGIYLVSMIAPDGVYNHKITITK